MDELIKRRKEKGITQKQLAEQTGLSIATIQGYEQGKFCPKADAKKKIMDALGMNPMDELIKRIEALADPDPDSDWKFGKNYGIMLAVGEIKRYTEEKKGE